MGVVCGALGGGGELGGAPVAGGFETVLDEIVSDTFTLPESIKAAMCAELGVKGGAAVAGDVCWVGVTGCRVGTVRGCDVFVPKPGWHPCSTVAMPHSTVAICTAVAHEGLERRVTGGPHSQIHTHLHMVLAAGGSFVHQGRASLTSAWLLTASLAGHLCVTGTGLH
jgi:hypothetical protein